MARVPDKQQELFKMPQQHRARVRLQHSLTRDNRQVQTCKETAAHSSRHQEQPHQALLLQDKVVAQQGRQRNRNRHISVETAVAHRRHHIRRQAEAAVHHRHIRRQAEAVVRHHRRHIQRQAEVAARRLHQWEVLREEARVVAEEAQAAVEAEVAVKIQI